MHADDVRARRGTYRFVHASELRLDAPARGIAAPPLSAALRDASLRAWQSLVELAIERSAAFVILTGALFDSDTPTLRACAALRDGLYRLRAHGIDVSIALAESDGPSAALVPWLADATLFAPDRIDTARVVRDGHTLATLRGASAGPPDTRRLAATLRRLGDGLQIGVLPGATGIEPARARGTPRAAGSAAHGDTADLVSTQLDYWALGGSSARIVLHEDPWVVLAGTTQGRGFAPGEIGPKSCTVVEVEAGRIGRVTQAELDHVRFVSLQLDVSECADAAALSQALLHQLEPQVGEDRITVVEAVLNGRRRWRAEPDRVGFENALRGDLQRACAAWSAPIWWVHAHDRTSPAGRDAAIGPWDLGRIVSEQSEALSAPLPGSTYLARIFTPLLRQWDAETNMAAQRELVRDAAAQALTILDGGGRG